MRRLALCALLRYNLGAVIMARQTEIELYLERAGSALQQARDNLNLHYYDVATSRAYYGMFYAASALLASKGISRSKHSGVHSAFGQYFSSLS